MVRIISPGSRQTNGGCPGLIQVAPAGAVADSQPILPAKQGIDTQRDTGANCPLKNAV